MDEAETVSRSPKAHPIPCKVWNVDRTVKKAVVATSLDELLSKGKLKLGVAENALVSIVLEEDGTEVDDDEYLRCLNPNTTFIFLKENQVWKAKDNVQGNEDEPDFTGNIVSDGDFDDCGPETSERLASIVNVINGNTAKIITLSNEEMEIFASADQQQVADLMKITFRETGRMQLTCQRYLDDRTQAFDAINVLKTCEQQSNKRQRTN